MKWFHGTDTKSKENILKTGFTPCYGRFGKGVYFTDDKAEAECFGSAIITISMTNSSDIANIYYPKLVEIYPDLAVDEEEGVTDLKEYVTEKLNKKAAVLTYASGEKELCVYDTSIISIGEE